LPKINLPKSRNHDKDHLIKRRLREMNLINNSASPRMKSSKFSNMRMDKLNKRNKVMASLNDQLNIKRKKKITDKRLTNINTDSRNMNFSRAITDQFTISNSPKETSRFPKMIDINKSQSEPVDSKCNYLDYHL